MTTKKISFENEKNLILIAGNSGSGKTKLGLGLQVFIPNSKFLDVGAMLRQKAETDPEIKKILDQGQKIPSEKIKKILHDEIESTIEKTIILASMPRSKGDAEIILNLYHFFKTMVLVYVNVPEHECIRRLSYRNDGSRPDDKDMVVIQNRMRQFPGILQGVHYLEENGLEIINLSDIKNKILDNVFHVLSKLDKTIVKFSPYVRLAGDKVFSGPSCGGKGTAKNWFLVDLQMNLFFKEPVSATTRPPGDNEVDGREYYFLSKDVFEQKIGNDEFLEWQQVYSGDYYGVLKSEVQKVHDSGYYCFFDIDVKGAESIKQINPNTLCIGITPPNLEILEQRMIARNLKEGRNLSSEKMMERLRKFDHEVLYILQNQNVFDRHFINGNLDLFYQKLKNYLFATNASHFVK